MEGDREVNHVADPIQSKIAFDHWSLKWQSRHSPQHAQ